MNWERSAVELMSRSIINRNAQQQVVGLIPAAGRATRLAPLPCSKELFPIGFMRSDKNGHMYPKVACHYVLEQMQRAGISKAFIVLRNGKWDIPAYFEDGQMVKMHLSYLVTRILSGTPYTLDQAYAFIKDSVVALGFPDIIVKPDEAFVQLLAHLAKSGDDVVLGLFEQPRSEKWDMIDVDEGGRISRIVIKPLRTHLRYSWAIAVWNPVFSHFMHSYLADSLRSDEQGMTNDLGTERKELFVGDVIQAAIDAGLGVSGVIFPGQRCLDIGTADDLAKAVRKLFRIDGAGPDK